jgi:hypothetical protein
MHFKLICLYILLIEIAVCVENVLILANLQTIAILMLLFYFWMNRPLFPKLAVFTVHVHSPPFPIDDTLQRNLPIDLPLKTLTFFPFLLFEELNALFIIKL